MEENPDYVSESRRLRMVAARSRFEAIMSQLSLAGSFCAMAETELIYGHVDAAHELIQKVRHMAQTVRCHVDEPHHVPPDQVHIPCGELAKLEKRIQSIEARLKR